jgi:hypothetical protein
METRVAAEAPSAHPAPSGMSGVVLARFSAMHLT